MFFQKFPQFVAATCSSLFLLSIFCAASPIAVHPTSPGDSSYIAALATADHLLQAWQAGDAENGMALLTLRAKEKAGAEVIEKFFSQASSTAYEIEHGKLLKRGCYEFPVLLISSAPDMSRMRRQFSTIIILNTGNNSWAVDKLP
jgi:hypothetical protein